MRAIYRPSAVLLLVSVAGCSYIAGNEGQARSALKNKLDRWVAGDKTDHLMMPLELALVDSPTSYEIKSFIPNDKGSSKDKSFLASVSLDFKSNAGSPTQRVLRYMVNWDEKAGDWKVFEESRQVFSSTP